MAGRRATGLRRWHRWCGLGALLLLLVAAATGSLLVYKKAIVQLLVAPAAALPAGFGPEHMAGELDRIVATIAPAQRARIKAPTTEEPYWTLTGADGQDALLAIGSLQPYNDHRWLLAAFAFVRALHTELLTGAVGEALLLASASVGLFLSITGLILWWPSRRSFRWRWLLPRPRPAKQLLVSHLHTGAAATLVLVLLMLTGAVMLWQKLAGPLLPPDPVTALTRAELPPTAPPSHWLRAALAAVPDGWPTFIRLDDGAASVRFRLPGEWHSNGRTTVTFDTATGAGHLTLRADQAPPARRLLNQLYPLHSGYGMAGWYAALICFGGLALLWLSVTGGLSWLRRRAH